MKTYKDFASLSEKKNYYEVYHQTYTSAIYAMEKFANKNGYILDPEEMASTVGMGPRKPGKGKTNSLSVKIYKSKADLIAGKSQRKQIHFQVYNRGQDGNTYELNTYVS